MPWCLQHSVYRSHPSEWEVLMVFNSEEEARTVWRGVYATVDTIAKRLGANVRKWTGMIVAVEFDDHKQMFKISKIHKC